MEGGYNDVKLLFSFCMDITISSAFGLATPVYFMLSLCAFGYFQQVLKKDLPRL